MVPANDRQRLEQYFKRLPEWPFVLVVIAILLLIAGPGWPQRILALAGLAGAAWFVLHLIYGSPRDAEVDALIRVDLEDLKKHSLGRCHLVPKQTLRDSVVFVGPRFRHLGGAKFGFRRGADDIARFTPLHVTVIHFTQHQLVIYQCALDLVTGKPLNERIEEFFYTDVVSVAIHSDSFTYDKRDLDAKVLSRIPKLAESAVEGKIQVAGAEFFSLSTAGGSSIEVMLNDPELIEQLGGGRVETARVDDKVQAVLQMVRDKKLGALPLRRSTV